MMKVSVVIPNYNGKAFLKACLESLDRQDMQDFEVLVVDDASTDGAVEELMKQRSSLAGRYPLRVLRHEKNRGFCTSVNDGIDEARAPYVLLLNNDTEVREDFVRQMLLAIQKKKDVFSCSAQMRSLHDPELMDDAGDDYCALGWAYAPARDKKVGAYERPREIFAACGGAAIYRRDLLLELGGFDERHFAYLEDMDMGYRARLFGYRNVYAPKAVVWHAGSGSSGSRYNEFKIRLSSRNNVYLIWKNMPGWQILFNAPFLGAGFLAKILFFWKKGFGKLYISGLMEGIKYCRTEEAAGHRVDFTKIPGKRIWKIELLLLRNVLRRFGSV